MRIRNLLFTSIAVAGLTVTGTLAQNTGGQPQSPPTATGNTGATHQPNDVLQGRIQQDLRSQNLNHVKVKVNDKKVVLSGNVPDDASRANAIQIAQSMAQPDRQVVDHIQVGNNANNQAPPMSEQPSGRYGSNNGTGMNNPSQPMPPPTRH